MIPTPRTIIQAHAPIPLQNFEQTMADPEANALLNTIMDGLGISVNTYVPETKTRKRTPSVADTIRARKAAATRARKKALQGAP